MKRAFVVTTAPLTWTEARRLVDELRERGRRAHVRSRPSGAVDSDRGRVHTTGSARRSST